MKIVDLELYRQFRELEKEIHLEKQRQEREKMIYQCECGSTSLKILKSTRVKCAECDAFHDHLRVLVMGDSDDETK
jgi:predicted SprT family Zn-dependent metalloprotease